MPSLKNFSDRKGQCFTSFLFYHIPYWPLICTLTFLKKKKGCNACPSVANLNTLQLQFWNKNACFWPFSVKFSVKEKKRSLIFTAIIGCSVMNEIQKNPIIFWPFVLAFVLHYHFTFRVSFCFRPPALTSGNWMGFWLVFL